MSQEPLNACWQACRLLSPLRRPLLRRPVLLISLLDSTVEVIGWAGRLWSHYAPANFSPYVMQVRLGARRREESHNLNTDLFQICCLVIAPTFYSAALYWAAGLAIANVAPQMSWLSGRAFKTFFITADLVSLIVQAVGGGMAGSAVGTDPQQVKTGSKWVVSCAPDRPSGGKLTATFSIMLAGIVSQLVVMLFYVAYTAVWVFRAREKVKLAGSRFQWMLVGMLAASIGIVVRGVSPPQGSST